MFKKILIPTDGSEFGKDALDQGIDLARLAGGEVTILFALENPYEPFQAYGAQPPEYFDKLMVDFKSEAHKALERASAQAAAKGVVVHPQIVEDHPVPAILRAAQEHDLVVMATHGRKGIDRVMMGSVTDKVLHNCSTPVLVVRGAAN